MNALRPSIERPGKSRLEQQLSRRYANLLAVHDRCRRSVSTASRLPGVYLALRVVADRIASLRDERLAA